MSIQWYPGHMTKAVRMMQENLKLIDIVIEILDARIPLSSKNPDINKLAKDKHRIILLNKSDLANDTITNQWKNYFIDQGFKAVAIDCKTGRGFKDFTDITNQIVKERHEKARARGRIFIPTRAMIVGIPNVGKSTFINKHIGRALTKTGDRPGVTKGKQWIKVDKNLDLLDTPGILWPKFESQEVGIRLAITGAINDQIVDRYDLCLKLIDIIKLQGMEKNIINRYNISTEVISIEELFSSNDDILNKIAISRGFLKKGAELDMERTSIILLDEFRAGKLGKLSLDFVPTELESV